MIHIADKDDIDIESKINILKGILGIIGNLKKAQKPAIASFWFSSLRYSITKYYGNREYYRACFNSKGWITTAIKFEKKIKLDIQNLESCYKEN